MSVSPSQHELLTRANEALLQGMQTLGIEVEAREGAILCVGTPLQVLCHEVVVSGEGSIVSLAIHLALGSQRSDPVISECVAGFASDFDAALTNAVTNWMLSVLLTAMAWHNSDACPAHMASSENREFPDRSGQMRSWCIVSSPALAMGDFEGDPQTMDTKETLMPLFAELTRAPKMHWVKAFVTHLPGGQNNGDCTVDNITSEKGKRLLFSSRTLARPPMLRQFHILCPLESEAVEEDLANAKPQARPSFWARLRGMKH
ncbi:hypothetical protein EON83_13250 [bacterium]|nr:MAG: hypothetical protein EON83_13250 [bacterium]